MAVFEWNIFVVNILFFGKVLFYIKIVYQTLP